MRKPPSGTNTTPGPYTPNNFGDKFEGPMTLRYALAHSKNVPAVKVAEMVGYDKVADVARAVGLNLNIQPTPSIALGSYEVTPLEIASAYTVFPNGGDLLKSGFIKAIRDGNGADYVSSQAAAAAGHRSAGGVPGGEHDGGRAERHRHRRARACHGLHSSRRRKNRNFARRLVRGIHLQDHLRGVGGLRRQPRLQAGRRPQRPAHLGGVHEAGASARRNTRTSIPSSRRTASSPSISTRVPASWPRPIVPRTKCAARCSSPGASRCRSATFTAADGLWSRAGIRCSSRPRRPRRPLSGRERYGSGRGPEYATGPGRPAPRLRAAFRLRRPAAQPEPEKKKGFFGRLRDIFK